MSAQHDDAFVHPYIPNSVPEVRQQMLREIGLSDVEEILAEIPSALRTSGLLDVPEPLLSEYDLRRHVQGVLDRSVSCAEVLSFLGGGCCQHFVPAVCDEIISRGEFLTAYTGGSYSDLGKHQARFEYNSLMAELLDYDVVVESVYDWGNAAGFAIRMAARVTERRQALIPQNLGQERRSIIAELCGPEYVEGHIELVEVACEGRTGHVDLDDLASKLSPDTAALYFENPGYLGQLEPQAADICQLAKSAGAVSIAGVDPISLGIVSAPGSFGADIAVGDLQPLGLHMSAGTGLSGFMAFADDEVLIRECPFCIYTIVETTVPGEHTFAELLAERTSYGLRDMAPDFGGTQTGLWAICAAVYLASMGPQGMREVAETIVRRSHYAAARLSEVPGIELPMSRGFFKEFPVNFDRSGKSVAEINQALLRRGIFGGLDLSTDYPELGQSALVCVTEAHSRSDIDRLAASLEEVLA